MLGLQQTESPEGFLEPAEMVRLSSNWRTYRLTKRPHDLRVTLREKLGLPKPRHNRLALEYQQLTWNTRHVVVPYCSMAIAGRMTTYCYALSYHLLERGTVFEGNVVTRELEEKLNGKDDYGLIFYTLTGSYTNRGYPTFLITFERLKRKGKTRVHFHRVHPMRSKDGDRNPVSNWIKVSYNWMIGNVAVADVAFQQGDLAFVKLSKEKAAKVDFSAATDVTDCDSHCFTQPVKFAPAAGKSKHVLGHVSIPEKGVKLVHPEHDNVAAKTGVFQVRQCRSWEANPRGIWTLNFD